MFPGLSDVTYAAMIATTTSRTFEIVTRRVVDAVGSIIL